jgi:sugar lactone lactonase YvrE
MTNFRKPLGFPIYQKTIALRFLGMALFALVWLAFGVSTAQTTNFVLGTSALLVGPSAGSNSVVLGVTPTNATWTATTNATWLHLSLDNQSGEGSTNVIFSYDANPGDTRSGALTIGGQRVIVTQASSRYIQVGMVTTLVLTNVNQNGVAVDPSGNVYIGVYFSNALTEWKVTNNEVSILAPSGLSGAEGVALDRAGNVYVADYIGNSVKEWEASSGNVITLVSSGLSGPEGVAVDGAGNVYIADTGGHALKEWIAATSNVITLVSQPSSQFTKVAVDVAGNVYVADFAEQTIYEWSSANKSFNGLVANLTGVVGVAVDGSGNVYSTDYNLGAIRKWTAASGTVSTLVSSGLYQPESVAVDGAGNVYIADTWNNAVKELPYAFVDPSPKVEGMVAGTDSLSPVLSPSENLLPPFYPVSDEPWLSITNVTNGVVTFSFSATTASRVGHITLLGQTISIYQSSGNSFVTLGTTNRLEGPAAGSDSVVLL